MSHITVQDIMETHVVSVKATTPVLEVHEMIANNKFDGVPVVDDEMHLLGLVTEYDMIEKGSSLHLPTFQKVLSQLEVFRKDRSHFSKEIEALQNLTAKDVMNTDPMLFRENATLDEVITTFKEHHRVNPIPVVDKDHVVVGIVSRYDVLQLLEEFRDPNHMHTNE